MSDGLNKMYKTVMDDHFPQKFSIVFDDQELKFRKRTWKIPDENEVLIEKGLRYGENPGQEAALYELVNGNLELGDCRFITPGNGLVSAITDADLIQSGKHPGKINLTDIDNALNIMKYLMEDPTVVIVKHNNPCGVAYDSSLSKAYNKANMADRIAAYGGCAAFNRSLDRQTAELISENFLEVVVAPEFEEGVTELLAKSKNLRIIRINRIDELANFQNYRFLEFKSLIDGGIILQQSPLNEIKSAKDFKSATTKFEGKTYAIERQPTEEEKADMLFGWLVEQGVTSNSIIYVKDGVTVGIGTGEQDRVGVAEIAAGKAHTKHADKICFEKYGIGYKDFLLKVEQGLETDTKLLEIDDLTDEAKGGLIGAAMISDAFFPFRDGVDVGLRLGIRAIVHPGGSLKDFESILACNDADPQVTMVYTGQRAFKH